MDPWLSSSMRQAAQICETPRLELKSSPTFLAIQRCQQTKIQKVINLERSLSNTQGNQCCLLGMHLFINPFKGGPHNTLTKPCSKRANKIPTCLKVMMIPYWTTLLSIWYTSPLHPLLASIRVINKPVKSKVMIALLACHHLQTIQLSITVLRQFLH